MKLYMLLAATFVLGTGLLLALAAPAKQTPPNILFVFADQWRACSTGYAGDPNVKTPNLDSQPSEKQSCQTITKADSRPDVPVLYAIPRLIDDRPTADHPRPFPQRRPSQ